MNWLILVAVVGILIGGAVAVTIARKRRFDRMEQYRKRRIERISNDWNAMLEKRKVAPSSSDQ